MAALDLYFNTYRCEGDWLAASDNPAPALVLVHGWGLHGGVWDSLMPRLLQHFEVTVVDLPGMGRSPVRAHQYDLDYLVEQLLAIAPPQALWMGWSLGGLATLAIAARFPERVTGVVTLATSPQFTRSEGWDAAMDPVLLEQFMAIFEEDWEGTLIRFLALQCKGSDSMRADVKELRDMLYFHGIPAQQALRGGLRILKESSVVAELSEIQCPTLHILGEHDHLVPAALLGVLQKHQPTAQTCLIEGVSHVPFLSAPDVVATAIDDFLRESGLCP